MKSITHKTTLILALAALSLSACKKDGTSGGNSTTQPLYSGSWKLTTFEIKAKDSTWVKATPPDLVASAVYTFKSDGTYVDAGSGSTGNWSMFDNGQSMEISGVEYHIALLNSTTLQLVNGQETFPYDVNGTVATYYGERDTYSH